MKVKPSENQYFCAECKSKGRDKLAAELHEIWGASNRTFSIENSLQIPLCRECHTKAHNNGARRLHCEILGLEFDMMNKFMNTRLENKESAAQLELAGHLVYKKLSEFEVVE